MYRTNVVMEDFALAGDFSGQKVKITPHAGKNARVAYVKFISLTDDEYATYQKPESAQKTLAFDNDGFTDFSSGKFSDIRSLKYFAMQKLAEQAGMGEVVWCLGTTGMLNYNSPTVWSFFENTEPEKKPKDMFDLRDKDGNVIDYERCV